MPNDVYQFEQFRGIDNNLSTADYAGILFVWHQPNEEDSDDEAEDDRDTANENSDESDEKNQDFECGFQSIRDRDVRLHLAPTNDMSIWLFRYTEEEDDMNQSWWVSLCNSRELLGLDSKFRVGYCVNTTQENVVLLGFRIELDCKQNNLLRRSFNAYAVADGSPFEKIDDIESPPKPGTPRTVRNDDTHSEKSFVVREDEDNYDSDNFYE